MSAMARRVPACVALLVSSALAPAYAEADRRAGEGAPTEEECLRFARELEATVSAGDPSAFRKAFDVGSIVDKAVEGLDVGDEMLEGMRSGVRASADLGGEICRSVGENGSYGLLRVHGDARGRRALFRMLAGGGLNYHDLILARAEGGGVRIVDVHVFLAGEDMSATVRRALLPVVADANRSFLGKLLGSESDYVRALPKIQGMQALAKQGKAAEALDECLKLPQSLQKDKNILIQRIGYATKVGEAAYKEAAADFRKHHPKDPALDLVMMDYHFYRKEFDRALACVDGVDGSVGGDPYLDFMRANLHYAAGRRAEAKASAARAVEREPTLIQPYWTLLTMALEEKDFAETARLLTTVEARFDLRFDALAEAEPYADFVKSPEYAKWLEARAAPEDEGAAREDEPDAAPAPAE